MARKYSETVELTPLSPVGSHTRNTALSTTVTLAPPVGAGRVLLQSLGANVRYTLDGQAPTATFGFVLRKDDPPTLLVLAEGMTLTVIQESSGAELQLQWGV